MTNWKIQIMISWSHWIRITWTFYHHHVFMIWHFKSRFETRFHDCRFFTITWFWNHEINPALMLKSGGPARARVLLYPEDSLSSYTLISEPILMKPTAKESGINLLSIENSAERICVLCPMYQEQAPSEKKHQFLHPLSPVLGIQSDLSRMHSRGKIRIYQPMIYIFFGFCLLVPEVQNIPQTRFPCFFYKKLVQGLFGEWYDAFQTQ